MTATFKAHASVAALLIGLSLTAPTVAQTQRTLFNTPDFRQDRELWTDPAYYRNNTPGQLRGMAINVPGRRTGQELWHASTGPKGRARRVPATSRVPIPIRTRGITIRRC